MIRETKKKLLKGAMKKWEGSKEDEAMDKKLGYKEGSKEDNTADKSAIANKYKNLKK